ncbi:protein Mis18-alpha [Trichechus manatus latirostris]|uniref:Protein yippee-like n=1 Tax=Trichechus manatus latirostris TaxID=127582 RepID=A0A2Y9G0Q0_TRIMA|nr:protein Mis18-alpha [Trichechus manatus latirostris]
MAGTSSLYCCKRCSSVSCACDQGKWSDSSLLGRRLSEDSSRQQLLQQWASMWSSGSWSAPAAGAEETWRGEAAEEERPLVFLCSGCRRPLGDSLSWVTSQEDPDCILLRCQSGRAGGMGSPSSQGSGQLTPSLLECWSMCLAGMPMKEDQSLENAMCGEAEGL